MKFINLHLIALIALQSTQTHQLLQPVPNNTSCTKRLAIILWDTTVCHFNAQPFKCPVTVMGQKQTNMRVKYKIDFLSYR